jgi:hypothetical protein
MRRNIRGNMGATFMWQCTGCGVRWNVTAKEPKEMTSACPKCGLIYIIPEERAAAEYEAWNERECKDLLIERQPPFINRGAMLAIDALACIAAPFTLPFILTAMDRSIVFNGFVVFYSIVLCLLSWGLAIFSIFSAANEARNCNRKLNGRNETRQFNRKPSEPPAPNPESKDREIANLLALFLGIFSWTYTFKKDWVYLCIFIIVIVVLSCVELPYGVLMGFVGWLASLALAIFRSRKF